MSARNVLVLVVDSLRADAIHGSHIETPTVDALGEDGAVFLQCVSTTTSTTPSFSSMLTGCYPPKHGVRGLQGYRLSPALTTLAEAFETAGYETHAEVTGPLVPETGVLRGFGEARHRPGYKVKFLGWPDEIVSVMRTYREPWLMLLHVWEVHRPYRPPPDHVRRWDREGYEAVVHAVDAALGPIFEAAGDDALIVFTGDHGEEYAESAWQQKQIRAAKKARRTFRLHKWAPALDKRLAAKATGHGFALYEHLIRVPLILRGPGVRSARIEDQVRHVDLFPTLADLCGLQAPPGIDGRSLRPLLEGDSLPEEPAYLEAVGVKLEGKRISGARTPDWKLLKAGDSRPVLYKLGWGNEPDERHNLISRYPEVAQTLDAFIEQVLTSDVAAESGMTSQEEEVVEQHLRDLGYL